MIMQGHTLFFDVRTCQVPPFKGTRMGACNFTPALLFCSTFCSTCHDISFSLHCYAGRCGLSRSSAAQLAPQCARGFSLISETSTLLSLRTRARRSRHTCQFNSPWHPLNIIPPRVGSEDSNPIEISVRCDAANHSSHPPGWNGPSLDSTKPVKKRKKAFSSVVTRSLLTWAEKVESSPSFSQRDVCHLANELSKVPFARRKDWPPAALLALEKCIRAVAVPLETQGHLLALHNVLSQQKGLCILIREPPPEHAGLRASATELLNSAMNHGICRNEQAVVHCDLQRLMGIPCIPFWVQFNAQGLTMTAEWAGNGPRRRPRWAPQVNLALVRVLETFYRAGNLPAEISKGFLQEIPAAVQASLPFLPPSEQVPAVYCLGRLSAPGAPLHGVPTSTTLGAQAATVVSQELPHLDANLAERTVLALVNLHPPAAGAAAIAAAVAQRAATAAASAAPTAEDTGAIWKLLEHLTTMRVQLGGEAAAAVLSLLESEARRGNVSLKHAIYISKYLPALGMPAVCPDLLSAMLCSAARSSSHVLRNMLANKTSQRFVGQLGPTPAVAAARHIGAVVTTWEGLDEAASLFISLADHAGDVSKGADQLQGLMASLESAVAEVMTFTSRPWSGSELPSLLQRLEAQSQGVGCSKVGGAKAEAARLREGGVGEVGGGQIRLAQTEGAGLDKTGGLWLQEAQVWDSGEVVKVHEAEGQTLARGLEGPEGLQGNGTLARDGRVGKGGEEQNNIFEVQDGRGDKFANVQAAADEMNAVQKVRAQEGQLRGKKGTDTESGALQGNSVEVGEASGQNGDAKTVASEDRQERPVVPQASEQLSSGGELAELQGNGIEVANTTDGQQISDHLVPAKSTQALPLNSRLGPGEAGKHKSGQKGMDCLREVARRGPEAVNTNTNKCEDGRHTGRDERQSKGKQGWQRGGNRSRHRVAIKDLAGKVPGDLGQWTQEVESWGAAARQEGSSERCSAANKLLENAKRNVGLTPSILWVGKPAAAFLVLVKVSIAAMREAAEVDECTMHSGDQPSTTFSEGQLPAANGTHRRDGDELAVATTNLKGEHSVGVSSMVAETVASRGGSHINTGPSAALDADSAGGWSVSGSAAESVRAQEVDQAAAEGSSSGGAIPSASRLLRLVAEVLRTHKELAGVLREDAAAWSTLRQLVHSVLQAEKLYTDTEIIVGVCFLQMVMEETATGFWEAVAGHGLVETDLGAESPFVRWGNTQLVLRIHPRAMEALLRLAAQEPAAVPEHLLKQLPLGAATAASRLDPRRALSFVFYTAALGIPVEERPVAELVAVAVPALHSLKHRIAVEALEKLGVIRARMTPELAAALYLHVTAGDPPRTGGRWRALLAATAQLRSAHLSDKLAAAAVEGIHIAAVTHKICLGESVECLRLLQVLGVDVPKNAAAAVTGAALAKLLACLEGYEKRRCGFAAAVAHRLGMPKASSPEQILLAADERIRPISDVAVLVAELERLSQALDAEMALCGAKRGPRYQPGKDSELGEHSGSQVKAPDRSKEQEGSSRVGPTRGHNTSGYPRSGSSFAAATAEAGRRMLLSNGVACDVNPSVQAATREHKITVHECL
jgi:hypothetical protein